MFSLSKTEEVKLGTRKCCKLLSVMCCSCSRSYLKKENKETGWFVKIFWMCQGSCILSSLCCPSYQCRSYVYSLSSTFADELCASLYLYLFFLPSTQTTLIKSLLYTYQFSFIHSFTYLLIFRVALYISSFCISRAVFTKECLPDA